MNLYDKKNTYKSKLSELAIFGAAPMFPEPLHVGRPNIGSKESFINRVNDIFERRWLTNAGPYVQEFEKRLSKFLRAKHCIVMCNGTIALEITTRALGLKGEVIIPSFTFIATAHSLQWQEITPVFCDIDPGTHNIDPACIERMITPRTTGIIGVHLWGRPCEVESLERIAAKHSLKLVFDAAHAFACSYKGKMIGNFGNAEIFSFHATKFFNTFEGGAIVTNDDDLASKIRLMKNFGFAGYDNVIYIGTNGKMSEISAAMGLTGLESLDEFIGINKQNYYAYLNELNDLLGVLMVRYGEQENCNYQYIVLEIDENVTGISRDAIMEILHAENILARRYFYPGCHRMEPYQSFFPHAGLLLPETELLAKRILLLPTGTGINKEQISAVCSVLRFIIGHAPDINERFKSKK